MRNKDGVEFEYLYRSVEDAERYALAAGFGVKRMQYSIHASRPDVQGIFELTEMPGKYKRWYWKRYGESGIRYGANIPAAR